LRPQGSQDDNISSAADGTRRIQVQQPAREESADVDERDAPSEQSAAPPVEESAPPPVHRDREVTAAPPAVPRVAEPVVSKKWSNPPTTIHRLPSVFAPPPLARNNDGGLPLHAAKSPAAPAPLPPAPATSISTMHEERLNALSSEQPAIVDLPAPPVESAAEKPASLWQHFVQLPKKFKKAPRREPRQREPAPAALVNTDQAETEQGTNNGNWFGSFGQRMLEPPPPPQWIQDRMARKNPPVAGGE
jgi:hypothetical protein